MKTLLWALGLAIFAVAIAIGLRANQGSVVALAPPWRFDISLNFFLVLLLLLLWVAYRAGRGIQRMVDFPERVRAYRERRSELTGHRGLREALKALFEGRFARAERAAHRMQEFERREKWMERAEKDPELAMARLVQSAEMWAEQRDNARALQVIEQLHAAGARHIHSMRIALGAHLQSGHWEDALRIVRALDKHKGLPGPASKAYKVLAYRGLLRERADDAESLERTWNSIPASDRAVSELALEAARCFNRLGRAETAARILEQSLQQNWNERLLAEYAGCAQLPATGALLRMERWMQMHGRSAAALRCAGRICLRAQLWGKARSYLEESQRTQENPETSLALAELAQALGDPAMAAECFRSAAIGMAQRQAETVGARPRGFRREPSI